jgi:exodeoxyribonuclease V alpha subunit
MTMAEMENTDLLCLNGKAVAIIFQNEGNGYKVFRFRLNDEAEKVITVTGICPVLKLDVLYNLYGEYVEHPRYGIQFSLHYLEPVLPSGHDAEVRYLSGINFPGIGKKTAEKIVSAIGEDSVRKLKEDISLLDQIDLSDKQKQSIRDGLNADDEGMQDLIRFLDIHGIGVRNVVRLHKKYGRDAVRKLSENPYRVVEECDGFGFETADKIGMHLGFAPDDERRLSVLVGCTVMNLCVRSGDSYVTEDELRSAFAREAKGLACDFDQLLQINQDHKVLIREEDRIYPATQFEAEDYTASFLKEFPYASLEEVPDEILSGYLESIEEHYHITYDARQIAAILSIFHHPFTILTGGPGTGKTTVVHALIRLFQLVYPDSSVICCAPTGRAAKRLGDLAEVQAATIHSLLKWDLETNTFGKNEDDPIVCDLLIVDEFSMVDDWLFANLLKASRNVKKICIIGDEDQLPSVGPGCVLRDLIASGLFPVERLEHIYRQKEGSDVIQLAWQIRRSQLDLDSLHNDVSFIDCPDYQVKQAVIEVVQMAMARNYSLNDIQVLSPMYKGNCGIDVLNSALQACFNPPKPDKREVRRGYITFREGDKILQLKNQPDDEVYNGDIGVLEEIVEAKESEDHKRKLVVNFQDVYVEYDAESLNNITLAYCISVHKAQGSEYPIVIIPISRQHTIMLKKNLLYTGCTRARKGLVLLGDRNAFIKGAMTPDTHPRRTTLKERLLNETPDSEETEWPF